MGMKEMTSWPIDKTLFIDGQNMKCDFKFGMTMAIPFLVCPIHVTLSSSHTMNLHSSKMMKGKSVGTIKTADQPPNQKARGNC